MAAAVAARISPDRLSITVRASTSSDVPALLRMYGAKAAQIKPSTRRPKTTVGLRNRS